LTLRRKVQAGMVSGTTHPRCGTVLTWLVKADGAEVDYRDCTRFCTVDLAASLKASADFTVVCSVAARGADLFVLDIVRRRMEGPDIVPAIRDQMSRHDLRVAHIEAAGFQLALVQEARRDGLPVKELRADRDKVARSLPLEARMEHGTVWFPGTQHGCPTST